MENWCYSIIMTTRRVIITGYDVILYQSKSAYLYNHPDNQGNYYITNPVKEIEPTQNLAPLSSKPAAERENHYLGYGLCIALH